MKNPFGLFLILFFLASCGGPSIEDSLTPPQRQALEDFLREHPKAQLVQTSDCTNPDLLKFQSENPGYKPYFAEGDFTRNGSLDFVVATMSAGAYDLWLFPGSGFDYGTPMNFAKLTWLHEAGLITRNQVLFVGGFYSDEGNYYSWDASINRFAIVSAEEK